MSIKVDASSFFKGIENLSGAMKTAILQGVNDVASEIMRLSTFEVPHDTGMLQASGHIEPYRDDEVIAGYNKVYAARLHENPQYHFQKGRKGKYLEDPIKNNLRVFIGYMENAVNTALK